MTGPRSDKRIERGDFQTPLPLAIEVMRKLAGEGRAPATVLEPTCGRGAFLRAAGEVFPEATLIGLEIDATYVEEARSLVPRASVEQADFFEVPWADRLRELPAPILVAGNPPWVTSATLGAIRGANAPPKRNDDGLRGLDARTGAANFDVSEWMLAALLDALEGRDDTIALLVKLSVVRKIVARCAKRSSAWVGSFHHIDARRHFGASVDAGLLTLWRAERLDAPARWSVYEHLGAAEPSGFMAYTGSFVTADAGGYEQTRALESATPAGWRSGVKHDCAAVFELDVRDEALFDATGRAVDIEGDVVFPLLKGADLLRGEVAPRRALIVPQRTLKSGADLATTAPRADRYFSLHEAQLSARKSSVYTGRPRHAIFGVGDYSFAPFKIATSGLAKRLGFALVGPHRGKPVMLDDTCYFLPFWDERAAEQALAALQSPAARSFYEARIAWDAKRPITKKVLDALDLDAVRAHASSGCTDRPS
ncbi:MAG: SAM-dependent methyltransferase [Polyangiaceae bacterium]|nr:SAM-dependent methyltransferase [Polyangiaceae bacterium]